MQRITQPYWSAPTSAGHTLAAPAKPKPESNPVTEEEVEVASTEQGGVIHNPPDK